MVPNSYLWLLQPSKRVNPRNNGPMENLLKSFASAGVSARRVLFAPRTSKNAHIRRHAAADLFVDTIVYGAHSTATDALRGVSVFLCKLFCVVVCFLCRSTVFKSSFLDRRETLIFD